MWTSAGSSQLEGGPTLSGQFHAAGVSTLGRVVELPGPRLDNPVGPAAGLRIRSVCVVNQLLEHWRHKLSAHEQTLLMDFCDGILMPNCTDPFPAVNLYPDFKNCSV